VRAKVRLLGHPIHPMLIVFPLGAWLVENALQFLKVNGLDQMKIKSGVFRTLHVFFCAEAGERNGFDMSLRSRVCCNFVATPIG